MALDLEKKKQTYRRWYERNAEDFNEKRRKRYKSDPNYQARAKANAIAQKRKTRNGSSGTSGASGS
jgi:hypothetical protein